MLHRMNRIDHRPEMFENRMIGGGPLREYALPGQNGAYPLDVARLEEYKRMGGSMEAGSRIRKAKKWTGFAAETADKGLDLAAKGVKLFGGEAKGGKISRIRKAEKWTGFAEDTANKGLDLAAKGLKLFGSGARADMPAGAAATKAHMKALRESQGRAAVFVKGSDEAREHMAKLRAMRAKKPKVEGAPKRPTRAPSARAGIVKAVMAERGVSMIEASKIVKAEGLYTPKA
jgi:hypothetical protein